MGGSCNITIKLNITNVIWIEPENDKDEIRNYVEELEKNKSLKFKLFDDIDKAINYLKKIKFQETKIIVNGELYTEFVNSFKENINDIYIIPKIIVFTSNIDNFIKKYREEEIYKDKFYKYEDIANTFKKIRQFLKNEKEILSEIETKPKKYKHFGKAQLSIEYVNNIEKLFLPMFFKILIDDINKDSIKKFNNTLFSTYLNENDELQSLISSLDPTKDIPIEILSKYYIRILTVSNNFHKEISKNISKNKSKLILPFIKVLYEGLKLKSLPLTEHKILYMSTILSSEEIKNIKNNLTKKIKNLPSSIIFSKNFLIFTKDRLTAEKNLIESHKDSNVSKVLFVLEKGENNIDYNLATHCDLEKISYFNNHKEVLFFPFSTFGIKSINDLNLKKDIKVYEIKLVYLGDYLGFLENDRAVIEKENVIEENEFKKQIYDFGLVKKTKLSKINYKTLYETFLKYEKDMGIKHITLKIPDEEENKKVEEREREKEKENESKEKSLEAISKISSIKAKEDDTKETDIKLEISSINENDIKGNIAEIIITQEDINKDIQIINSFENYLRTEKSQQKEKYDDNLFKNEKEIKENVQIKIDENLIEFSYTYKFDKIGKHKIEYIFKNNLTKANHLFYKCDKLINLFLPRFNTQNVINMNSMFSCCKSLIQLGISKFNTENVTDMSHLFCECNNIKKLDLSNFKTRNVTNMLRMFHNCKSLTYVNLSNFNTQNVSNMSEMFFGCSSLDNLNLSNFNTQNVINMIGMFNGCSNLEKLDVSNFNTQNVTNMYCMFSCCDNLKNLNLSSFNTQNVTNMHCMFFNCINLKNLNLSKFNSQNIIDMNWMFNGCNSLKKKNIITNDQRILKYYDSQRVNIFNKIY